MMSPAGVLRGDVARVLQHKRQQGADDQQDEQTPTQLARIKQHEQQGDRDGHFEQTRDHQAKRREVEPVALHSHDSYQQQTDDEDIRLSVVEIAEGQGDRQQKEQRPLHRRQGTAPGGQTDEEDGRADDTPHQAADAVG